MIIKILNTIICSLILFNINCQEYKIGEISYTPKKYQYKQDIIEYLLISKKGEQNFSKPLFIFCQGSLPQPLIIKDSIYTYPILPFNSDSLLNEYHIVIIGKPFIPLIANVKQLDKNMCFLDSITNEYPREYNYRNYLDYYVNRNLKLLKTIIKENNISSKKIIVAGHSEGSTIAAKMAFKSNQITHLIYSSGNIYGRIMSIISKDRNIESNTDSTRYGEDDFNYWKDIVEHKSSFEINAGDSYKTTYDFSIPIFNILNKLKIPVYICYGSKDFCTPFNDYYRVASILNKKENITFKSYIGLEHNYFPILKDGSINYKVDNFSSVVLEWLKWLKQ